MSNPNYEIFDTFCIRTPLFSIQYLKKIIEKQEVAELELKNILNDSIFRESLYLASPVLYDQVEKWENGGLNDIKKIKIFYS